MRAVSMFRWFLGVALVAIAIFVWPTTDALRPGGWKDAVARLGSFVARPFATDGQKRTSALSDRADMANHEKMVEQRIAALSGKGGS